MQFLGEIEGMGVEPQAGFWQRESGEEGRGEVSQDLLKPDAGSNPGSARWSRPSPCRAGRRGELGAEPGLSEMEPGGTGGGLRAVPGAVRRGPADRGRFPGAVLHGRFRGRS